MTPMRGVPPRTSGIFSFTVPHAHHTVELLAGGGPSSKPLTDNESLATSLKKLEELLDKVYAYVEDVTVGRGRHGAL